MFTPVRGSSKVFRQNREQHHERRNYQMKSNRTALAAATVGFFRRLAFCIPVMMLFNAASANDQPSPGASKMPGAKGTIEYKPEGWKGTGVTTYWKDSDGIDPGVAGCHVEVTKAGKTFSGHRVFGEACSDGLLVESNPGRNVIHAHKDDLGHPDTFDCNAWCIGAKKAKAGLCVKVAGPAPCAASAKCECNK
jgi:hypothetical protein